MFRFQSNFLMLIVATLVATIALSLSSVHAETPNGRRVVIEIRSFKFNPELPVVRPGDTVVWINRDIVPHTVTARDGSWDSDTIKAGGRRQMDVTAGLSEAYFCKFHPAMVAALRISSSRRQSHRSEVDSQARFRSVQSSRLSKSPARLRH